MTLLETERLGRKISELLQQAGNPEIAPKLAADYATVCQAANLRLQQCEAMIKAGDQLQAIQLAETVPNLLDLVTVLEFRGVDEWRSYCQQYSLPVADRIDARSVQALNQCYAQGITTDHPLYAAYRRAVLGRNDEEALKTLQSITRLNPTDTNAVSELARLDGKVLAMRLQHLGSSLEGAEQALLVAEIETIETFGFKNRLDGEIWRKAQVVRCEYLLGEASRFKSASRWLEALAKLDFIRRLQTEFKLELSPDWLKQIEALEIWARSEQEKDQKEREFHALLAELQFRIHQSEEKDTSADYVKLPELRDDYEGLNKVWRSLTDFTRPISEEVAASFRKRSALLEGEIYRRTAIRRRLIVASSTAVLVVGAVIVWLVLGQMKTRDLSQQLQKATAQRQVHAAERLLERARTEKIGNENTVAAAGTFVARENALQANFETEFKKLPSQLTGDPVASRLSGLADQLSQVRNAFNALAPDLKAENEPRLQAFETQWQNYLAESGAQVNGLYEQWVSSAEKQSAALDYRAPLERTKGQLTELYDLLQKINDCEAGFKNNLQLRSDLSERAATVRSKFSTYDGELKKLEDGMTTVQKAHTSKEFLEGINQITASEFSTSPVAVAASAIQSLDVSDEAMLRVLLNVTNASTWAYLQKGQKAGFTPEIAMPAERQILQQLNNDPAINANQHYRLWLNSEGTESVEWIAVGAFEASTGWKRMTAWSPSASATGANFEDHDYGYFDNQYRLSTTQPIFRIEQLGIENEAASFRSAGLETILSSDGSYTKPLLEVLDSIKDSQEGSPLFRAYLYMRLSDLMNLQPDAWGLTFCPAVQMHARQINSMAGGQLNSGDWFVAAKVNSFSERLSQFFASIRSISYTKQANGLLALAQTASKSGLIYAGFVGLDGKPNFIEGMNPGELWGYNPAHKPVFLGESDQPFREQAMLLSPLFTLSDSRKDWLTIAGVKPDDASFQNVLPPLFR